MGDVLAEEPDGAGSRRKIAGDAVEQRGLAGAVGAEHGAPLARTHGQRHVGQRGERAEQPRHAAQLEGCAGTDRGKALGDAIHGRRPPPGCAGRPPRPRQRSHKPDDAVRREQHDDEEAKADQQTKTIAVEPDRDQEVEREGTQQNKNQGRR